MTVWVNISLSTRWQKPPFGIVRVEENVARYLHAELGGRRIRFCIWDPKPSAFIRWTGGVGSVAANDGLGEDVSDRLGTPPGERRGPKLAMMSLTRQLSGRRFHFALAALAGYIALGRRWVARLKSSLLGYRRQVQGRDLASKALANGCLRPGDVLITLGMEWETGCASALENIRSQGGVRILGCCHDVIPIRYPEYCLDYVARLFPTYLKQLAEGCDAIACVSDSSRHDLADVLQSLKIAAPSLCRITLGTNDVQKPGNEATSDVSLPDRPYLLYVSTLERRKNHRVLYRAMRQLVIWHGGEALPKLVFVGALGWGIEDTLKEIAADPATKDLIEHRPRVTDRALWLLYRQAQFCVFPSLYEGWGLPVAEALTHHKPVICSNLAPLHEVGGSFAEYVEPHDVTGWARAIERLWFDAAAREQVAQRIARDYQPTSWQATARQFAELAGALEKGSAAC